VYQPFASHAAQRGAAPVGIHPAIGLVATTPAWLFEADSTFRFR